MGRCVTVLGSRVARIRAMLKVVDVNAVEKRTQKERESEGL